MNYWRSGSISFLDNVKCVHKATSAFILEQATNTKDQRVSIITK